MADTPEVLFAKSANASDVSPYSLGVLRDVLIAAGLRSCVITSTARTPRHQAEVMYDNCYESQAALARQEQLYRGPGQAVIRVYKDCRAGYYNKDETVDAMTAKIIELGAENVSHHCVADFAKLNVFDVAPSSVQTKYISFERAARADARVAKFLTPPMDPGFHFEIPQPETQVAA